MGGIPPIPPGGERAHGWEIFGVGKPSGLSTPKIDPRLFRDSIYRNRASEARQCLAVGNWGESCLYVCKSKTCAHINSDPPVINSSLPEGAKQLEELT